jgi:cardiolipin synthase
VTSPWRHIPNLISLVRILLVIPVAWALATGRYGLSFILFAAAALSDAADGFLARHFAWQSELGGILDPIADKLLLATLFLTLAYVGLVPAWLTATVVARDMIIVGGAIAYRWHVGVLTAHPSVISKVNTLCQAAFVLSAVGNAEFGTPSQALKTWLGALVFATTAVSGIDYVLVYGRRAAVHDRQPA